MCLILFAHQTDSRFPLVVAANRDELYSRPTRHADFWPEAGTGDGVMAGKDLLAGGTWLGITVGGRFAAVTNIRDPSQPERKSRSRGELTLEFLRGTDSPANYSRQVQSRFDDYAGFNLLIGDKSSLYYLNNHHQVVTPLQPGVYGLSNGLLDAPWPKITRGRTLLQQMLEHDEKLSTDQLIAIMNERTEAADIDLPDTGVSKDLERKLSSTFIYHPERLYGTLCSTAIIVDAADQCRFSEQNYNERGHPSAAHFYQFTLHS